MLNKTSILYNRFIKLIEDEHRMITERFMNDLLKNPDTLAYRNLDVNFMYEETDKIYRELSKFISYEYPKDKIREKYNKIGVDRYNMDIPFSQVQKVITLQKRNLWLYILDKLYDDDAVYQDVIELSNRVILFFDRAVFYMLEGYESMIYKKPMPGSFHSFSL